MKLVNLESLLPKDLAPGERILWFGRPNGLSLWRRAYRADWVALYFVGLAAWGFASSTSDHGVVAGLTSATKTIGAGAAALSLLAGLAWLSARTTLYVVTSRRLVMKVGMALPIFYNVPYNQIGSASLRLHRDGTGDLPVALTNGQRIAYLTLWPSARPFRFTRPEPALRCIGDARAVADLLASALGKARSEARSLEPVPGDPLRSVAAAA